MLITMCFIQLTSCNLVGQLHVHPYKLCYNYHFKKDLSNLLEEESRQLSKNKSGFRVIRRKQLTEMMTKVGLDKKMDRVELEQAVQFLHECGVLLHYDDIKSNLSDLYFLDPQWLCFIMSKVITIKQLTLISKGVSRERYF